METFDLAEAARRIGISSDELNRWVELGILTPEPDQRFTSGHVRRAGLVVSLLGAGIPKEGLGAAARSGQVSLTFLDAPAFQRFSAFSGVTFAQMAERTGVPIELLSAVREAAGSAVPGPDDRMRDEELPYVEMISLLLKAGFRPAAIQQTLRVHGDSMRRLAEAESATYQSEIIEPGMLAVCARTRSWATTWATR